MKYLFTAIIVFTCFLSQAQTEATSAIGIWELSERIYNGQPSRPSENNSKRYKILTPSHFSVIDIDTKTNITKTSIFGTYTIENGIYTEKLLNVTADAASMIGKEFKFELKFDGNNILSQIGAFNGMETNEKWIRVISNK